VREGGEWGTRMMMGNYGPPPLPKDPPPLKKLADGRPAGRTQHT